MSADFAVRRSLSQRDIGALRKTKIILESFRRFYFAFFEMASVSSKKFKNEKRFAIQQNEHIWEDVL